MTVEGNPIGAAQVIAYEDLQCPDCAAYRRMLDNELLPKYGRQVAFETREFPLRKHAWAREAAIASIYFASISSQLAVAFRRYCYAHQGEISNQDVAARIHEFASMHGLDYGSEGASIAEQVDAEYNEGVARGIQRTPTVLIGDRKLVETFTLDEISSAIDRALATATKTE